MLKQRFITAAILVPLVVVSILYIPHLVFSLVLAVFISVAAWEWCKFTEQQHKFQNIIYVLFTILIITLLYYYRETFIANSVIFLGVAWWLCATVLIIAYQKELNLIPSINIIKSLIGLLILLPAWMSLIVLHASVDGPHFVLLLFILIWIADTSAYFIGRRFGSRKLASKTSPGKSWEGVLGALIITSITSIIYGVIQTQYATSVILMLCIVTVMFSIIGDLTESMFKRNVGIKDSGIIFPGHGGVLDRIDSMTAAAPVFVTGLWLIQGKL